MQTIVPECRFDFKPSQSLWQITQHWQPLNMNMSIWHTDIKNRHLSAVGLLLHPGETGGPSALCRLTKNLIPSCRHWQQGFAHKWRDSPANVAGHAGQMSYRQMGDAVLPLVTGSRHALSCPRAVYSEAGCDDSGALRPFVPTDERSLVFPYWERNSNESAAVRQRQDAYDPVRARVRKVSVCLLTAPRKTVYTYTSLR